MASEYQHYKTIEDFLHIVPQIHKLKELVGQEFTKKAKGSNYNHQTWEGGYLDHVCETMNIAYWLYLSSPRRLPFQLDDALVVLFLHDLEKPFKDEFGTWSTKEARRAFRTNLIQQNGIELTPAQWNALEYIEGEHDYSNKERRMGELAAFCHCCDLLSARLWYQFGKTKSWDQTQY